MILEGGTAVAIFIRCFADKKGIEQELEKRLYIKFPREVLATITVNIIISFPHWKISFIGFDFECKKSGLGLSQLLEMLQVLLALFTVYGSAAMGQLFFFHVVLIRKVSKIRKG